MDIEYPPYAITDKMLNLATKIMEKIGQANYFESLNRFPKLRRKTRIKSIHPFSDGNGMIFTSTQETTQKTTQEKIINLIKKKPNITQVEMAKALGLTRDGISYNIKALKEKGVIERVGSTKKEVGN